MGVIMVVTSTIVYIVCVMCVVNMLVTAVGDRVRVRIYSDPIPVAAPPDFTDISSSPSRSSCMISIFLLVSQAE